jgi:hypothetical protein
VAGTGLIVIMFCFGLAGGIVGRIKGSSFFLWFLISGLVPFFGLLAAIFYRWENQELRRQCPGCGRVVKLHDALCTRCGTELEFPQVAIVSEATMRERARSALTSRRDPPAAQAR